MTYIDEHIDQYKQIGLEYLAQTHAKRFARFSLKDIMELNEKAFDLVIISRPHPEYETLIQKVKSVNSQLIVISSN